MRPNILASIPAGDGEVYLDIHGSELGNLVTFEGAAGAFKIEPQLEVINTAGTYEVIVYDSNGTPSNAAKLEVRPAGAGSLVLLVPGDPITAQATSRSGAVVNFDVFRYDGNRPKHSTTSTATSRSPARRSRDRSSRSASRPSIARRGTPV